MATTAADRVREQMGDAQINNAGLIRWVSNNWEKALWEASPDAAERGYYSYANTDDDYNFTDIEDMVETMDLCCFQFPGGPDGHTGLLSVIIGVHDFYLNVQTNQLLSHDKQYIIGEKNDAVPIYEHQCRVNLWPRDDWCSERIA